MDTIKHYANFPATGVSLRQMVQFGEKPSVGMLPAYFHFRVDSLRDCWSYNYCRKRRLTLQAPCSARRSSSPRSCP